MKILLIPTMAAAMIFWSFGCSFRPTNLSLHQGEPLTRVDGEALFGYERAPINAEVEMVEEREGYDLLRVTFDAYSRDDPVNRTVTGWYYRQRTQEPTASIMQLPILGGDYGPSIMFAEYFARKGFHVLRMERKDGVLDPEADLHQTRRIIVSSIIDQRRALDWWLNQREVDRARVGVCGISMGGFQGSLLMGVESRFAAGVFLLNGGDFSRLMTISQEPEVVAFRDKVKSAMGWNDEEFYREVAKEMMPIDPLVFAPNLNPARVLFVTPRFDRSVPPELALEWYEAANRPSMITIPTGHYSAVIFITFIQNKSVAHFRKVFAQG